MKSVRAFALFTSAAMFSVLMFSGTLHAGLYDADIKDVTSGDIADQDYWWAKFDHEMLDLAVKQRQPEGRIDVNIGSSLRRLDDLIAKYPKHEDLKKWKAHAEEIEKKIDQNASRNTPFNAGCPWEESNYAQLWVNWHYAKMLLDKKDYGQAKSMLQNVEQNYDIMLKPGRMKDYPEDLRKWVEDSKDEADKMMAEAKAKTGG
jgi:hypothetical protein